MTINRRSASRKGAFRIGALSFAGERSDIDCLVWDQSETGAQIEVELPDEVPDTFILVMTAYAKPRLCTVVWRRERKLGVAFSV
ncbi:pilus assembly protein PilZ [Methylobacterium sp. W2]|uniref:pilus assembly protein PilZ n=1 Tax=Methylobacterium sp. W2 TaxID=2598107 RepID=UPI001D0CAE1E|nr:pilus assembly protein PilZ [Methylobacterium sp. W2]MCC0807585.1 pilus assembly protein PilZ [Methylobacterium sp. W2]